MTVKPWSAVGLEEIQHKPRPARSPCRDHPASGAVALLHGQGRNPAGRSSSPSTASGGQRADYERERARVDQLLSELLTATGDLMRAREVTRSVRGRDRRAAVTAQPPSLVAAPGRVRGRLRTRLIFYARGCSRPSSATAGQQKKKRAFDVGEVEFAAPCLYGSFMATETVGLVANCCARAKRPRRQGPSCGASHGRAACRPRVTDDRTAPLVSQTRLMTTGTMTGWLTSETSCRSIEAADDRQRFHAGPCKLFEHLRVKAEAQAAFGPRQPRHFSLGRIV